jgi:hypothetical protein
MTGRETASLWFWLGFVKNYAGKGRSKWRFPGFIKFKKYKGGYFWQDTLFTYWNRFLGCKLRGHRKVGFTYDSKDNKYRFCFNCYKRIEKL